MEAGELFFQKRPDAKEGEQLSTWSIALFTTDTANGQLREEYIRSAEVISERIRYILANDTVLSAMLIDSGIRFVGGGLSNV